MTAITENLRSEILSLAPLSSLIQKDYKSYGFHYECEIPSDAIRDTSLLFLRQNYYLECLTCTDFSDCFELTYIFNQWESCNRIAIKSLSKKGSTPSLFPSIQDIYSASNWYEREIFDMYGVEFSNHPSLTRLLLPQSSMIHPLLKSFKGEGDGSDIEEVKKLIDADTEGFEIRYPQNQNKYQDIYHINLGPQHPSTHGVLRVKLSLKGEKVIAAHPDIGYIHRNHEKMAEIQEYKAFWPNVGRLDYVGAMSYNFCYAALIERAMQIEVSERIHTIRVLLTEINRISSHLLWLGTYLLDLGAFTPFFYCFDDRERILDILEIVTGERLTYDHFRFGGLDRDYPADQITPKIKEFIPHFKNRLKDYQKLIGNNIIFRKRTDGIGIISKETALQYGVTGPNLRACGIEYDERKHEPYSIYPSLDFKIPVQSNSDAYARYLVRMEEMHESLKIIEQLYQKITPGPYKTEKLPRFVPKGEYYFNVESARGSFGMFLISDGSMQPYKIKLRTPSFSNLSGLNSYSKHTFMADMISILGSIDVVIPEVDR